MLLLHKIMCSLHHTQQSGCGLRTENWKLGKEKKCVLFVNVANLGVCLNPDCFLFLTLFDFIFAILPCSPWLDLISTMLLLSLPKVSMTYIIVSLLFPYFSLFFKWGNMFLHVFLVSDIWLPLPQINTRYTHFHAPIFIWAFSLKKHLFISVLSTIIYDH